VLIIKVYWKEKTPPFLTGFFAVLNLGKNFFDVEVKRYQLMKKSHRLLCGTFPL